MADAPTTAIVEALAQALRTITVANGYRTDLGLNVLTERTQTGVPAAPTCTVSIINKVRSGDGKSRPDNGRGLQGIIEYMLPSSFANATANAYAADDDIDRLLTDVYTQMPGALPVQYEETIFLDKPEGMPVVAAEIHWSTGYRRHG